VLNSHIRLLRVPVAIQTRRAQNVDASLRNAIRDACAHSPQISACYLLDSRRKDNGKTALLVAVMLDDEQKFEHVTQALADALTKFPPPPETWIISATSLPNIEAYRGTEFYVRDSTLE
jgi:hypothetical protein